MVAGRTLAAIGLLWCGAAIAAEALIPEPSIYDGFRPPLAQPAAEARPFGARTLAIPRPKNFLALSQGMPEMIQLSQSFLPPSNRLVEMYVLADDYRLIESGEPREIPYFYQLQVMRDLEGKPLEGKAFSAAAEAIAAGFKQAAGDGASKEIERITASGNRALTKKHGADAPNMSIGGVRYLGEFKREPWGQFFTVSAEYASSAPGDKPTRNISAVGIVLIDHQLLQLGAIARADRAGDDPMSESRRWAERVVFEWAQALRAANPDDPAVAAQARAMRPGWSWSRTLTWAVIGGAVGLIYSLLQRRK